MRSLTLSFALGLAFVVALGGCKKEEKAAPKPTMAPVTAGTVQADGVRRVDVEAAKEGFVPDKIAGKPGEKLLLVFKRTVDGSCIEELRTPDGKELNLPLNTPVEVAVTVPQSGEVGFACTMDMFKGAVVAQP
jgi:plastocyanin domain-containing protein